MAERRTFTHEYKREAVRLLTERKLSVSEASRQLGVGVNLLRKWRQALEAGGEQAPHGGRIAEDRGSVDVDHRHVRVCGEDRVRILEGPRRVR